ncbi:MAG: hypothetical protein K6357_05155 [Elusimicrobiota bacterium]
MILSIIFAILSGVNAIENGALNITIYNNDMAAVNQQYFENCKKGVFNITIPDMPKTVIADSINIELPDYLGLKMQSYKNNEDIPNYSISILTKDNDIISGKLYRYDDKQVTLKNEKGEYMVVLNDYIKYINYGNIDETEFRNRMLNNGSLNLVLESKKTQRCEFKVNYIVNNLSWSSSYDAYLNESETRLDINSRISITNNSGYNFKKSQVSLVAGVINKVSGREFRPTMVMAKALDVSFEDSGDKEIKPQSLSEFYSYDIPYKELDINSGETLSIDMFSRKDVKFKKVFVYKGQKDLWYFYDNINNYKYDKNLVVNFIFENNKDNNMELPLPQGRIRIYKKKGDFISLVGEDNILHTPVNGKVELNIGRAFDVSGERKIIKHEKVAPNVYRDTVEIKIKNDKNDDINVKIKEYLWGNWRIVESSAKYEKIDINNIEFNVNVAKKSTITVRFTAEYNFNQ